MLIPFHAIVQVCPADPLPIDSGEGSPAASVWTLPPGSSLPPFPLSFEAAAAALNDLPRLDCEPDGAFVWVGSTEQGETWQIDGLLTDRDGRLLTVELKGTASRSAFDRLLGCLRWPSTTLLFQLVPAGMIVDEPAFRARHGLAE